MKCRNCGTALFHGSSTCPNCNTSNEANNKKITSWKKVFTIVVILICLIASGTFAYGVIVGKSPKEAALDLMFWNKSTKELYFQAEFKSFQQDIANIEDYIGDMWHLQNEMMEHSYKNTVEIKGNFNVHGETDLTFSELQLMKLVLRGSKIVINSEVDPTKLTSFIDAKLNINGTPIIGTQFYQSKENTALKLPIVDNRYYYINNAEFGQVLNNIAPNTDRGYEMVNLVEEQKRFHLTQDDMLEFISNYAKVLNEQLKDEHFTMNDDVTYEGESLREITITLSEAEFKQLLLRSIAEVEQSEKINTILQSELYSSTELSISTNADDIYNLVKAQIEDNISFPEGFKMKVLINKDEYIVKRTISLPLTQKNMKGDVEFAYSSSTIGRDNIYINTKKLEVFELNGDANGVFVEWNSNVGQVDAKKSFDNTLSLKAIEDGEEYALLFNIQGTLLNEDSVKRLDSTYTVSFMDPIEPVTFSGTFNQSSDQNLKRNYSTIVSDMELTVPLSDDANSEDKVTINLNISSNTEFTEEVKQITLTPENSVNAQEMTPYDFMKLFDDLIREVESLVGNFGL